MVLFILYGFLGLAQGAKLPGNYGASEGQKPFTSQLNSCPVGSTALQAAVSIDALLSHANKLQSFAYSYPDRNRLFGGAAHNDTVSYVHDTLQNLGGYYNITLQPFSQYAYNDGDFELSVNGSSLEEAHLFSYSPNGNVSDYLVPVTNFGCELTDFTSAVSGHIALISRGECAFGLKVVNAGLSGAKAVVIYNNIEGSIAGTLGSPRDEGPYVPALSVTEATGLAWVRDTAAGNTVTVRVLISGSSTERRSTNNIIAQTVQGDSDNVIHVGAHSDSVSAGPGINDNGSGSISLLETAIQLSKFTVNNAVRFSWWSAEEQGLIGSTYYVDHLPQEERDKIRLYLNFDMVASPNYVLGTYDGDGAVFGVHGPPGSAEAKHLFQAFFSSIGQNSTSSEFNGRSDYGPFLEAGIACGGLDTGAEGIKTPIEEAMFGGKAGVAYDMNYHQAGDTVDNLAVDALEINARAIAHAVGVYANSFETLPHKKAKVQTQAMAPKMMWRGGALVM